MNLTIVPDWLNESLARHGGAGDRTPHALLIHGPAGIGKTRLGRALSRDLLCEGAVPTRGGCGVCVACQWFDQGGHPDFRRITSDAIAAAEGEDAGDDGDTGGASDDGPARSRRAPSKEIRVEQVRALQRFLAVGTHRSGARVVLIHPLEIVNDIAGNALLKMLEEPPPRTVFILVADHLGRIPATIVSRCQRIPLALPDAALALAWLRPQMPGRDSDAEVALALAGGAPLAALARASDAEATTGHGALVTFLARPSSEAAMALAESFARGAAGPVVSGMQMWLADCLSMRLAGRLRYHPTHAAVVARLVGGIHPNALVELSQRLVDARRSIDHPLNARLLFEGLFSDYATAMAALAEPA